MKLAKKTSDIHGFSDISTSEMESIVKETKIGKKDLNAAKGTYHENRDWAA